MRIRQVSINGYGRFAGRDITFDLGLQVIVGPNEQGKSTVRNFIGDMLYGQKRSATQRLYDESSQLRMPWENPDAYGGTLMYKLDDGSGIRVVRNFSRRDEFVHVFDEESGREITGDFATLRNRESNFAAEHLGLSKDVFLNIATINHLSLENLGEKNVLDQVRETILALADAGDEAHSSEATLRRLEERISRITGGDYRLGRADAQSKAHKRLLAPLPNARARLTALDEERQTVLEGQRGLARLAGERRAILDDVDALRERRRLIEENLRLLAARERARRLQEARNLRARIRTATQHCFALSKAREFPLERDPDVRRAENQRETARLQLERTRAEHDELGRQLEAERAGLGEEPPAASREIPEDLEERLNALTNTLQHLTQQRAQSEAQEQATRKRLEDAQRAVNALPDFSRVSPDPVEWLTQLASSFSVAVRTRNEECELRDKLRGEVQERRAAIAESRDLFEGQGGFLEQAREFEVRKRMYEEQRTRRAALLNSLEGTREEVAEKIPAFLWLAAFCSAFFLALIASYYYFEKAAILYAAALIILTVLYFAGSLAYARMRLARLARKIQETRGELDALERKKDEEPGVIQQLLDRAGRRSTRELEALYDQYREASAKVAARVEVLENQESRAAESEERVPQLLVRLGETFAQLGETVESEDDVQGAATRTIARYQAYREAKRSLAGCHAIIEKHRAERKRVGEACERTQEALAEVEEQLRATMRKAGFADQQRYKSTVAALRAYRNHVAERSEKRGRVILLEERICQLETQLEVERRGLREREQEVARLLAEAGVVSVEQWHALAKQAQEYREIWTRRKALEERLDTLLQGQDVGALEAAVLADGQWPAEDGKLPPVLGDTREELETEFEALTTAIDKRMQEEHEVHIRMTEQSAGLRSLNEIEEMQAVLERQITRLEFEQRATSHAMALIEEVTRDKHSRIAPKLAARAGAHLAEITGDAYGEILLNRDLSVSVRIPETKHVDEHPEKVLSTGTVDQIYLALRLALIQGMSENGESIPMLLDDPFANYDNIRLERTMRILHSLGEANQILLFTCRQDVVRAAQTVGASIMHL